MVFNNNDDIERAELYRLFATLFIHEPSDEIIMQAKEMFQMKSAESPQQIRMDFVNTFLGPGLHMAPYESLYNYPLGDRPRLWGKTTEEVQTFYNSAGLIVDEEINLIPDHISAELMFMTYLIENGFSEFQGRFLDQHLAKWTPEYCDEVNKHAGTIFYKEIANILREFILSDYELMSK